MKKIMTILAVYLIVEANACTDHIHILVKIPPKLNVSYLKGKSALKIFE